MYPDCHTVSMYTVCAAPAPSMVKVRVQHPPEASVKIHQVVKVRTRKCFVAVLWFECGQHLKTLYSCFIGSVLTFSFICWYGSISIENKSRLQGLTKICSKVVSLNHLKHICNTRTLKRAHAVLIKISLILEPWPLWFKQSVSWCVLCHQFSWCRITHDVTNMACVTSVVQHQ